jgi:hypothetical protein
MQQKAFAAVEESEAEEVVVDEGEHRADNDIQQTEAAITLLHCELRA